MTVNAPILEQSAVKESETASKKRTKQPPVSIVPRHLFNKSGLSQKKEEEFSGEASEKMVEEILARVAGTIAHTAFARIQKNKTLGKEPEKVDLEVSKKIDNSSLQEWTVETDLETVFYEDPILKNLFNKSIPNFGVGLSADLIEKVKERWSFLTDRLAVLTAASFENIPVLNNPNSVFVPEARLYPETKYTKFVLLKVNKPESRIKFPGGKKVNQLFNNIDFIRDLKLGEIDRQDFYYQIFASNETSDEDNYFGHETKFSNASFLFSEKFYNFLESVHFFYFSSIEELHNFLVNESNATIFSYAKDNAFTTERLKQFFAIRILLKAKKEFDYFMGGRSEVNTKEELTEVINTFDFWDEVDPEKYKNLVDKIPIESRHIYSPVNIRTDVLSFHFPREELSLEQETILNKMRNHLREIYSEGIEQHRVYEDLNFLKILDEAVNLGLRISLGDIKVINRPEDEVRAKKRKKNSRELQFYMTIMSEAVVAYRKQENPDHDFTIFNLMSDPLIKAFDESFILYLKLSEKPRFTFDLHFKEPLNDKTLLREINQKVVKPTNQAMQVVPKVKIKQEES